MSKFAWLLGGIALALGIGYFIRTIQPPPKTETVANTLPIAAEAATFEDVQLQNWSPFIHPSNKFKVLFPSAPQHATDNIEDPESKRIRQYDMYVAEKEANGNIYMVTLVTMPEEEKMNIDNDVLTKVFQDVVKANPESTVKKMELGKYEDHPSIDFAIENKTFVIEGKAFLVKNTLYSLTSVSKIENYNSKAFEHFVNSFELMEKEHDANPTQQ